MITMIILALAVPLAQLILLGLIYGKSGGKIYRSASGTFATATAALAFYIYAYINPFMDEGAIGFLLFGGFLGIAAVFLLFYYSRTPSTGSADDHPSLLHFVWGICLCIGLILWIILFSAALLSS